MLHTHACSYSYKLLRNNIWLNIPTCSFRTPHCSKASINGSSSLPFPSLLAWTILWIISFKPCRLCWKSFSWSLSASGGPCATCSWTIGMCDGRQWYEEVLMGALYLSSFLPLGLPLPCHPLSPPSPSNTSGNSLPVSLPPLLPQTHPPDRSDRYPGWTFGMSHSGELPCGLQHSPTTASLFPEGTHGMQSMQPWNSAKHTRHFLRTTILIAKQWESISILWITNVHVDC